MNSLQKLILNRIGITICLTIFISTITNAQSVSGVVMDKVTLQELKYATIGVVGKDIGTTTNEKGAFTINLVKSIDTDSIKISYVGYKSFYISIAALKKKAANGKLFLAYLDKEDYLLQEVTILSSKPKIYKDGFGLRIPGYAECFKTDISSELGSFYTTNKILTPNQITFKVKSCSFDSAIFSVNIYKVNSDSSLTNLMAKPVLSTIRKTSKGKEVVFLLKDCLKEKISNSYAICISLVSTAGDGKLKLPIYYGSGYWRKLCESKLERLPVKVGLSVKGYLE